LRSESIKLELFQFSRLVEGMQKFFLQYVHSLLQELEHLAEPDKSVFNLVDVSSLVLGRQHD
jgi:hypothetical protein